MDPIDDPELARDFRLIAAFAAGTSMLAASDIAANPKVHSSLISTLERELPGSWGGAVLTHPDADADIYLETVDGPNRFGYLEHHRLEGSRYYETDGSLLVRRGIHTPAQLLAVVRARVQQRIDYLGERGWQRVEPGGEATGEPGGYRHTERFKTAAAAEAVAAMLACRSPFEAAQAVSTAGGGQPVYEDPVQDQLWRWTLAWSGEQLGVDGAAAWRKNCEHRLWRLDAGLVGTYHRRSAIGHPHLAMAEACAQRLPLVFTDGWSVSAQAMLRREFDERLAVLWGSHVDPVAALGHFDRLAAAREHRRPHLDPALTAIDLPGELESVPTLTPAVDRFRHRLTLDLVDDAGPVPPSTTEATPGEQESRQVPLPMRAAGRRWAAWAEYGRDRTWRAYVPLPEGHPWIGLDLRDRPLAAIPAHLGPTFAGPIGDTWAVGFDCAVASEHQSRQCEPHADGDHDLPYVHTQVRSLIGHAALAKMTAEATAPIACRTAPRTDPVRSARPARTRHR